MLSAWYSVWLVKYLLGSSDSQVGTVQHFWNVAVELLAWASYGLHFICRGVKQLCFGLVTLKGLMRKVEAFSSRGFGLVAVKRLMHIVEAFSSRALWLHASGVAVIACIVAFRCLLQRALPMIQSRLHSLSKSMYTNKNCASAGGVGYCVSYGMCGAGFFNGLSRLYGMYGM